MHIITHPDDGTPTCNTHITVTQPASQRRNLKAENIPQVLKDQPQWGVRIGKVPYQPHCPEKKASSTDPSTWGTFDKALEVYEENPTFDGIGRFCSEEDPYQVLDYDGCIDPETGELHDVVTQQQEDLDSYAEISPSGTGLRAIAKARKPGTRCSTKKTPWGAEFAIYEHSKFVTITGRVLGGYTEIREAQEAIDLAYYAAFGEEEKPPPPSEGIGNTLTDSELIERACKSKNGARFRRNHFESDTTGYPSRSEADFAHLADLCFWTGGDKERMVKLFSISALYLPEKGMRYVHRSAKKAIIHHHGGYYLPKKEETPKEVLERVEELEKLWWDKSFPGVGGKTDASIQRALLHVGKRIGTIQDGDLRVSISVRDLAELANCHVNTVLAFTKRAESSGFIRKDTHRAKEEDAAAFILLARLSYDTPYDTEGCVLESVTTSSRSQVADLTTEHYRWRGPVGKGRERALCALEAFGPQTAEELAERLGWSRARDLKARYLEPLAKLGLVEDWDGIWALPGDCCEYQKLQEEVREIAYSTVQDRAKRILSTEGLWVTIVEPSGSVASEEERGRKDRESHARQRAAYRYHLEERRKARERRSEENREITALQNRWDDERAEADGTILELAPAACPEVVDGVVRHDPECACPWCEDGAPGEEEVA